MAKQIRIKRSTILKGTLGGTAGAGIISALIVPGVVLEQTKEELRLAKEEIKVAEKEKTEATISLMATSHELGSVKAYVDTLNQSNSRLKATVKRYEDVIVTLRNTLYISKLTNVRYEDYIAELRNSITSLQTLLADKDETIEAKDKWLKITKENLKKRQREYVKLENEFKALQKVFSADKQKLQESLVELERENEDLFKQFNELLGVVNWQMQYNLLVLGEMEDLLTKLNSLQEAYNEASSENKQLEKKNEELSEKLSTITHQLNLHKSNIDALKKYVTEGGKCPLLWGSSDHGLSQLDTNFKCKDK